MQEKANHIEIGPLIKIISHDLRGPLGNLKSVVSLFKSGELPMEQAKEFMNHIEVGVDKSIEMLDGLLAWSSASSGKQDVATFSINEMIEEVIELLQPQADQKEVKIQFINEEAFDVTYVKNAMKVILRNLMDNAIKFTPTGGAVDILLNAENGQLHVAIKDSGIGVPAAMKETLFQMNKDNRRLGTANEKGAGLGLFMCNDLIQKNDSKIWMEDNADGIGSTFYFNAPIA